MYIHKDLSLYVNVCVCEGGVSSEIYEHNCVLKI